MNWLPALRHFHQVARQQHYISLLSCLATNYQVSCVSISRASIVKMLMQQRNRSYSKLPSKVKGESQRKASASGCERCKDHYVANPFTFASVQVQMHGSSNRLHPRHRHRNTVHINLNTRHHVRCNSSWSKTRGCP
jgi:hypothetical protein